MKFCVEIILENVKRQYLDRIMDKSKYIMKIIHQNLQKHVASYCRGNDSSKTVPIGAGW